jgi:hypothetical protein
VRASILLVGVVGLTPTVGAQTQTPQPQADAAAQALRQEIEQLRRDFEARLREIAQTSQSQADVAAEPLEQKIEQLRRDFEARLSELQSHLATIEDTSPQQPGASQPPPQQAAPPPTQAPTGQTPPQPSAPVPPGAEGAGGPGGALPVYGGAVSGSKVFNPDIAVIGDFLGAAGTPTINPLQPTFEMHESELSLQAIVDPYARADFFLSFGQEGVTLEEGYATFPTLPGGILMKVGKFRTAFGKVNTLHNHVLPWTDRPLVTYNLVAGEDGINNAGFSFARLIPNPWVFLEATGQIIHGDSDDVFRSVERTDLTYIAHLRGYQDLSESTNIDLGASYALGHTALAQSIVVPTPFLTSLYGIDATLRWRPLQRSIYRSFVGRSEVIWSHRDQPGGLQRAMGFYVSGDYQFARRWFVGARIDQSDRAQNAALRDTGQSLVLTYWPSEFSQIRGQYQRTDYPDVPNSNEFLFQFQFSIGAHGAHPF